MANPKSRSPFFAEALIHRWPGAVLTIRGDELVEWRHDTQTATPTQEQVEKCIVDFEGEGAMLDNARMLQRSDSLLACTQLLVDVVETLISAGAIATADLSPEAQESYGLLKVRAIGSRTPGDAVRGGR